MVNTTDIIFDNIRFIESTQRSLTIANIGQVPVQFEFINKPGLGQPAGPLQVMMMIMIWW